MDLAIYGAGGMGGEILTLAETINRAEKRWSSILFIDDTGTKDEYFGFPVYTFDTFASRFALDAVEITISVGEPRSREKMAQRVDRFGYRLATLIAPGTAIPRGVIIGEGAILMSKTVGLGNSAHIGRNAILQGYCAVGHGTVIGANTNVSCYVMISGNCHIGKSVFFGVYAAVKERVTIGDNAIIGMCAPVHRNVPANYTVFHALSKMAPHDPETGALDGDYFQEK